MNFIDLKQSNGHASWQSPDIFNYVDYREFLLHFYQFKKSVNPRFSYRMFSRLVGKTAENYIKLIVTGKRRLTLPAAEKVARLAGMTQDQTDYFYTLIQCNHAQDGPTRQLFETKLNRLKPQQPINPIPSQALTILENWFVPALIEVTHLTDFRMDLGWIQRRLRFPVTQEDIKRGLHQLNQLGFISLTEGSMQENATLRSRGGDIPVQVIQDYHAKILDLSKQALSAVSVSSREYSSSAIGISTDRFRELKEELRQFNQHLLRKYGVEGCVDQVVQVNFQMFPLTKETL